MVKLNHYMTVKEAARFLGVSPMTLRRWDNEDKLKAIRHPMNNYRLYQRKRLERILKEIAAGKKGA